MDLFEVLQVITKFSLWGQELLNVWHVLNVNDASISDVVTDVRNWLNDIYANVISQQSTAVGYDSISFKDVSTGAEVGIFDWPTITAGTYSNDPLPNGVAALATFPTAIPKVRGRKFLPGFGEGDTENGLFNSSALGSIEGFIAEALTLRVGADEDNTYIMGVVDSGGTFRGFQSGIARNVPAYQRRRKQGVGS